jgi:MFS transporter, NNP family, nitrate/nitrite transporter
MRGADHGSVARNVAFLMVIFFLNIISRTLLSPMLVSIEQDFHISHARASTVFLVANMGFAVSMFLSGYVSHALRHWGAISVSILGLGAAHVFLLLARTFLGFCAGLLVMGLLSGLYLPSALAVITERVDRERWGRAIALHELAPTLSFIAAPVLYLLASTLATWRALFAGLSAGSLIAGLLFVMFSPGGRMVGARPSFDSLKALLREKRIWNLIVALSLATGMSIGVFSIMPTYLIAELKFDGQTVYALLSASRILSLAAILFTGWLIDRLSARNMIIVVSLVSGVLTTLIGVTRGTVLLGIVFVQPLLLTTLFPTIVKACALIGDDRTRNLNYSLLIPISTLVGAGLIPKGMGMIGQAASFRYAFIALGGLQLFSLGTQRLLDRSNTNAR